MTNKDQNCVLANDIDSGIVILGCEANLNFYVQTQMMYLLMVHSNVVRHISSNCIPYMDLRMGITFHQCFVFCLPDQEIVT